MVKKAAVLKAPGTNNDYETWFALKEAGASPEIVHVNQVYRREKKLDDYAILVIPGGFSYGDDLGAGKVFSLFMKYREKEEILRFVRKGKPVLGICNGFQALVKAGLLPGFSEMQQATLAANVTGRFICRWEKLDVNKGIKWFKGLPAEIELPIAHAEGRFTANEEICVRLKEDKLVAFTYIDNPNGSAYNIAGIVNREGNVLGMMPHPERFLFEYQYPGAEKGKIIPWGKIIYRNIVQYA